VVEWKGDYRFVAGVVTVDKMIIATVGMDESDSMLGRSGVQPEGAFS
jgi:hypothetical protein